MTGEREPARVSSGTTGADVNWSVYGEDLRLLALLHDREPTVDLIERLREAWPKDLIGLPLADPAGVSALDFLRVALSENVTPIDAAGLDELAADYAAIYLNHAYRVSPSESPWIDPDGLTSQQSMFEVRDWYRHWGMEAPDWRRRPDDHLVVEMQFVAHLLTIGTPAALLDAARFLDHHLLRWYGAFADGVERRCRTPYWAAIVNLTLVHLDTLRDRLARLDGCERIEMEPIEVEKARRRQVAVGETCASARTFVPGSGPTM